MESETLKLGEIYEHYKGKKYRTLNVVRHSETLEELVLYETLYENEMGNLWVRPKNMFLEPILVNEKWVHRFRLLRKK